MNENDLKLVRRRVEKQNRQAWVAAGYDSDMASAIACRPPESSKLRRVYHLTGPEHAISDIALSRLKVARFTDVNDPFELLAVNFRERPVRKTISSFKAALNAKKGLLCFSKDWKEPLLWSHYAYRHRGICLGFNIPSDKLDKVNYEDNRILMKLHGNDDPSALPQDLQDLLLRTKYGGWRYEEEYRQFIPLEKAVQEGGLYFMPFGAELELAEVILGPECVLSLDAVKKIVTAKYSGVAVYSARLMYKRFRIVPKEETIPLPTGL